MITAAEFARAAIFKIIVNRLLQDQKVLNGKNRIPASFENTCASLKISN